MSSEFWLGLGLPPELLVFLAAVLPVSELRGALPLAINVLGIPWYWAYLIALAGNLLPIPVILVLLEKVLNLLERFSFMRGFTRWIYALGQRRSTPVEKYKRIGLMMLVAVPLPVTGAWTGSLVEVVLGLNQRGFDLYQSGGGYCRGNSDLFVFAGLVRSYTCGRSAGWYRGLPHNTLKKPTSLT
ncbi:putative small multi-drug export protein [Dehalococcoides mccartyi BTF08]|uniref:COG2426 family protein n=1 Tax=Dehalococcoides mccartyi TaxID=61435 RepID=UPI0002B762A1|nr:small multi-drug export protein [Dehalococcoides mccartyi]AGG07766.1 putative small multi-drug export protein [Dehalococcoides mccartyi BTF08]